MKIFALSGSNSENSSNTKLLNFIKNNFEQDVEVADVRGIPLFKEGAEVPAKITELAEKIADSDLILISTPERLHSVPSCLKSVIDWFSVSGNPLAGKKVVILSADNSPQGGARAQTRLKTILSNSTFHVTIFGQDEFMLSNADHAFEADRLVDTNTIKFLYHFFDEVFEWSK
ncbi:MAG: NAD(P)H-dependent oxidoreductase [Lactobacillus sp.]|nr:NAD(P)H-dependent oxidoreductase [Lactobacillus sp.]